MFTSYLSIAAQIVFAAREVKTWSESQASGDTARRLANSKGRALLLSLASPRQTGKAVAAKGDRFALNDRGLTAVSLHMFSYGIDFVFPARVPGLLASYLRPA